MTWSILHSASQVLALAGLCSVFISTLMLWKRVRTRMRNYYSQSGQTASAYGENQGSSRTHMTGRATRHWVVILPLMTGLSLLGNMWLMWREFHPNPQAATYEYSDVRFLSQIDQVGYSWWMEKSDGPFRADFCHDYNLPALNAQPGEVLKRLRYRDMGSCWSIRDSDLGFWFYRDRANWTIGTDITMDFNTALRGIKDVKR